MITEAGKEGKNAAKGNAAALVTALPFAAFAVHSCAGQECTGQINYASRLVMPSMAMSK